MDQNPGPFAVKDCSLAAIATGIRVQNLKEMRDRLSTIHAGCLFHHFWARLLRPQFDVQEYRNDFAAWAARGLHDRRLAERLARVDPTSTRNDEELRLVLLDVLESHLDEHEHIPWARYDRQFHFVRSQVVIFDTGLQPDSPEELGDAIATFTPGSMFFHFVEARRRTENREDDFRAWLASRGVPTEPLRNRLAAIHPYQFSLAEMRDQVASAFGRQGTGVHS